MLKVVFEFFKFFVDNNNNNNNNNNNDKILECI